MADVQYADVIRTVNGLLKTKYPEITRYGNDTVDKAVPPYFFVECVPAGMDRQTKNMLHKSCSDHVCPESPGPVGQPGKSGGDRGTAWNDSPDQRSGTPGSPVQPRVYQ